MVLGIHGHRVVPARHAGTPCRADTALQRAGRAGRAVRAVPARVMGQVIGPQHGTWAEFPCRAAHGPRPFSPCRAGPRPVSPEYTLNYQF